MRIGMTAEDLDAYKRATALDYRDGSHRMNRNLVDQRPLSGLFRADLPCDFVKVLPHEA